MVECQLPKLDVAGSSPVSRSIFSNESGGGSGFWLTLILTPISEAIALPIATREE